jgi:murein DD-endopeptidase MepM/ murein hydrolase activator NlpD
MLQESEVIKLSKLYEGNCKITSPFGPRDLGNGDKRDHKGADYVGIDSKKIIAPTNGKIVSSQIITNKSNPTWEWGNYVKMDDLNGFYLFFCHLANRNVKAGQTIAKSQMIGLEGATGYSFGSHLHFEVRRKSDNVSIDPEEYFKILAAWEEKQKKLTVTKATELVQEKANLDDGTINYLLKYPYGGDLMIKLAEAIK